MATRVYNNNKGLISLSTNDTYEVTFYLMFGGILDKIESRTLPTRVARKKGYPDQWTLYVSNVPSWVIDTWRTEQAYGNITEFVNVRNKLKKRIKYELASR